MQIIECTTCKSMFRDTDRTRTCPLGHSNDWVDEEDDEYPIGSVVG